MHVHFKSVLKINFIAWRCGFTFHSLVARQPVRRRDLSTMLLNSKQQIIYYVIRTDDSINELVCITYWMTLKFRGDRGYLVYRVFCTLNSNSLPFLSFNDILSLKVYETTHQTISM